VGNDGPFQSVGERKAVNVEPRETCFCSTDVHRMRTFRRLCLSDFTSLLDKRKRPRKFARPWHHEINLGRRLTSRALKIIRRLLSSSPNWPFERILSVGRQFTLPWKKAPTFRAVERKALDVIEAGKAPASAADAATFILVALNDRLEKADLRKVVPRKQITPQQASRRMKADGFRINGDIYLKPDRLRSWIPSPRDRVVLRENGVFRTRRGDAATIEQVVAGIPGKPRYYVLDSRKLEYLLRKKRSDI
jgi:hypothetical protein